MTKTRESVFPTQEPKGQLEVSLLVLRSLEAANLLDQKRKEALYLEKFTGFLVAALKTTKLYPQLSQVDQEYLLTELQKLLLDPNLRPKLELPLNHDLKAYDINSQFSGELKTIKQALTGRYLANTETRISKYRASNFLVQVIHKFVIYVSWREVKSEADLRSYKDKEAIAPVIRPSEQRTTQLNRHSEPRIGKRRLLTP